MLLKKIRKFIRALGPGLTTGASDDDPSGIATYSQTGALFGVSQLWTALFSFPLMAVVQEMCGRIGIVTGKGLAGVMKEHYSKKILYFSVFLLLLANVINIGADLGAMAASAELLLPFSQLFWLLVITGVSLVLQIFVPYSSYSKLLKYLTFSLFAYVVAAFVIKPDWLLAIKSTFIPKIELSEKYILNLVAILGTTISPYLFFWQASQEVEEEISKKEIIGIGKGTPKFNNGDITNMQVDTTAGMFFSNIVMFFIILTTASTLGTHGITEITTASEAAEALRPLAGDFAYLLFACGVIGTGLLAVPVLAGSAGYALSETFGWKEGLYNDLAKAPRFYAVIGGSLLIGLLINILPIPPFKFLYYSAILNGICAPPLLVLIVLISRNEKIMGKNKNTRLSTVIGSLAALIMAVSVGILFFTFLKSRI